MQQILNEFFVLIGKGSTYQPIHIQTHKTAQLTKCQIDKYLKILPTDLINVIFDLMYSQFDDKQVQSIVLETQDNAENLYEFKNRHGNWCTILLDGNEIEILNESRISVNLNTIYGKLFCTRAMIPTTLYTPVELGLICKFMERNLSQCSLWITKKQKALMGIAPNGDIFGIRYIQSNNLKIT